MNGVFYVATGAKFRTEAVASVRSLKRWHPKLHVTLYTDKNPEEQTFDRVILIPNPKMTGQDKVECFQLVDYEQALYLDTDTYVAGDIGDVFTVLERFNFLAMVDPMRGYWYQNAAIPDSFPEVNGGVVGFRNTPETKKLFADWLRYYEESKAWQKGLSRVLDQPSLRKALYLAEGIRMVSLPSEYNALRVHGTFLWGKVKLVHGRGNIDALATRMNRQEKVARSFHQELGMIAEFSMISWKQVLEIVLRVNYFALVDLKRRLLKCFQKKV